MAYAIETRNLEKVYGGFFWGRKVHALNPLNLTVPEGSIFGFLGPNGAGKTTTIKLLMDLLRPTGGDALVLGQPPENIEVKQRIGFLPDSPAFGTHLTAHEFLNICAKLLRIPSDVRRTRIQEVLVKVDMVKSANLKLGGFSRGMLQRIGIAQAILNNPKLLILDEPLLGLDPHGRQDLKDIILTQRASGATVFFSSHILSDVETICDHIAILKNGNLLCQGRLDELLSSVGIKIRIAPSFTEAAAELLPLAKGTTRGADGFWELNSDDTPDLRERIEKLRKINPDGVSIAASRETLETYFFRLIEKS